MSHEHATAKERFFPHEGLTAYKLARQAVQFVQARRAKLRGLPGDAAPQLLRAVVGAHTNLCSGAAHSGAEAQRHFRILCRAKYYAELDRLSRLFVGSRRRCGSALSWGVLWLRAAMSLSGGRKRPRRKPGGVTALIASSFSFGSARV
jgi:hypothetical protein